MLPLASGDELKMRRVQSHQGQEQPQNREDKGRAKATTHHQRTQGSSKRDQEWLREQPGRIGEDTKEESYFQTGRRAQRGREGV